MGGGYVLGMMLHTFQGWLAPLLGGLSVMLMVTAIGVFIKEGRARERADRERHRQ
jgi:hypothetical protein